MTEKRILKLKLAIQKSRSRLINVHSGFADILQNALYVADNEVFRISTNGHCIYFNPDWLQRLREEELDFILAHQVMHITLGHIDRSLYYKGERFHLACDIIANAYLNKLGWGYEALSHIGTIYRYTFYPVEYGYGLTPEEAMKKVPFDPALETRSRRKYVIDSDLRWDDKDDRGENGTIILRPGDDDPFCEGKTYKSGIKFIKYRTDRENNASFEKTESEYESDNSYKSLETWDKKSSADIKVLKHIKSENQNDKEDDEQLRLWKQIRTSRLDWRKLLNVFVREELCDYSFTPPDRRFSDEDFFLPDYNVLSEKTKNILFMVDTSVSVKNEQLSAAYSELCSAVYQFGDSLEGVLAFFDSRVYRPMTFDSISELKNIKPLGGGATDFNCIFEYVQNSMTNNLPLSIVIFTDGKGDYPPENAAINIPVLWMLTSTHHLPDWGKCVIIDE